MRPFFDSSRTLLSPGLFSSGLFSRASGFRVSSVSTGPAWLRSLSLGLALTALLVATPATARDTTDLSTRPTFAEFVGSNIFLDIGDTPLAPFGAARLYLWAYMIGDFAGSARDLAFNPADGWGGIDLDSQIARLSTGGPLDGDAAGQRELMLVLEDTFAHTGYESHQVPIPPGADSKQVSAWDDYREICFQVAARYGNANPPSGVSVRSSNQPLTGLGSIHSIEPRNEAYRWWEGDTRLFERPDGTFEERTDADWAPEEEAAMMVACYDGVKAADPNLRVSWPGAPGWDAEQFRRIHDWLEVINGGVFPADEYVVNLYWNRRGAAPDYVYTDGLDWGEDAQGFQPEALGGYREFVETMMATIRSYYPDLEVVIGEFGYDTGPSSVMKAPGTALTSPEKQQAQWLVRSFLALFANDLERAYVYNMIGDDDHLFSGAGLIGYDRMPRPSWFYVAGTLEVLGETRFDRVLESGHENVEIYRMASSDDRQIYAIWAGTADDTVVSGYALDLGEQAAAGATATLRELTEGSPDHWLATPTSTPLAITSGQVSIDVSETPVFVEVVSTVLFSDNFETGDLSLWTLE